MAKKRVHDEPSIVERRKAIAADVAAFLESGNKIERIPNGVSGQDSFGRSKHIVLGRPKNR